MLNKLALALLVASLVSPALAAQIALSGEVTYRERVALPDNATLRIELIDLALPDRPRLSVEAPTGAGQVPLSFTLTFEDSLILPRHDYALNAEIHAAGLTFRNAEPYPVTPLAQTEPVSIVTSLVAQAEPAAPQAETGPTDLAILNVTWQATMIGPNPVPPGVDMSLLIENDMRAGGMGGCNSWFSQAMVAETAFAIGDVAKTQRSCLYERNMLEQSFFDALKASTSWRIDNDTLLLLDSSANPTVQFTPR